MSTKTPRTPDQPKTLTRTRINDGGEGDDPTKSFAVKERRRLLTDDEADDIEATAGTFETNADIQKWFRCYQRFRQKSAALRIQQFFRSHLLRKSAAVRVQQFRRNFAAVRIQRFFRSHLIKEASFKHEWWNRSFEKYQWNRQLSLTLRRNGSSSKSKSSPCQRPAFPCEFFVQRKGPIEKKWVHQYGTYAFEPRDGAHWKPRHLTNVKGLTHIDRCRRKHCQDCGVYWQYWLLGAHTHVQETADLYPVLSDQPDRESFAPSIIEHCWQSLESFDANHGKLRAFLTDQTNKASWSNKRNDPMIKGKFSLQERYRSDMYGNVISKCKYDGSDRPSKAITAYNIDHVFPWSRGGQNHILNCMALHWGANIVKTNVIVNRVSDEKRSRFETGLLVEDMIALGDVVADPNITCTWKDIDHIICGSILPLSGNTASFQKLLKAESDNVSHGARVWNCLKQLSEIREENSGFFNQGHYSLTWRQERTKKKLPTHLVVKCDHSSLKRGVHAALGWDTMKKGGNDVGWVGTGAERVNVAYICPGNEKPSSVTWGKKGTQWDWCAAPSG
eukprot:m.119009 g.119009  ORF g.119009 m.119009 type:complete len:560 (-) comp28717_c0_seq1:289-1968(-)